MSGAPHEAPRRRVLVVDDEPANLSTFRRVFRNHYEVSTAESGPIALGMIADHDFDVVLTDFGMPEMDGAQLVRAAKQLPPVAFVMVTGYMDKPEVHELQVAGDLFCVVGKPWERKTILDAVDGASTHTQAMRAKTLR